MGALPAQDGETGKLVFEYTGRVQSFKVPLDASVITVYACGASGSGGSDMSKGAGGKGGCLTSVFTVTPGQTLYIFVGGVGGNTGSNAGGYNGGGKSGAGGGSGGGGGGATDIRTIENSLESRLLVGGGGGGNSGSAAGGIGGYHAGSGTSNDFNTYAGGGTQSQGGLGSCCPSGQPTCNNGVAACGGSGTLGIGGSAIYTSSSGGGGGGYYGGGAGGPRGVDGGGGGGSSYASGSETTYQDGVNFGNGLLTIRCKGLPPLVTPKKVLFRPFQDQAFRVIGEKMEISRTITVSYVIGLVSSRKRGSSEKHGNVKAARSACVSNLLFFLEHGLVNNSDVKIILSTTSSRSVWQLNTLNSARSYVQANSYSNVRFNMSSKSSVYLIHSDVARRYKSTTTNFIFLSCQTRGPFYSSHIAQQTWVDKFLESLDGTNHLVATTLSCANAPQLPSHALAVDQLGVEVLLQTWIGRHRTGIRSMEVALSSAVLGGGFSVKILDSRFSSHNFSENVVKSCIRNEFSGPKYYPCKQRNDKNCIPLEPCEVMFVESELSEREDSSVASPVDEEHPCRAQTTPLRPHLNVSDLWSQIALYGHNPHVLRAEAKSEVLVVAKVAFYNTNKLQNFLTLLKSLSSFNFRVLVVCSDKTVMTSTGLILQSIANVPFKVSLLEIPAELFDIYNQHQRLICQKNELANVKGQQKSTFFLYHFCSLNAPLMYDIIDAVVANINRVYTKLRWLMLVNVDYKQLNTMIKAFQFTAESKPGDTKNAVSVDVSATPFNAVDVFVSGKQVEKVDPGSFKASFVTEATADCIVLSTATLTAMGGSLMLSELPSRPSLVDYLGVEKKLLLRLKSSRLHVISSPDAESNAIQDLFRKKSSSFLTRNHAYSVVVSYAIYLPNLVSPVNEQCSKNLDMFLLYGVPPVVDLPGVVLVFNLISSETKQLEQLDKLAKRYRNVHIVRTKKTLTDLSIHSRVLQQYVESKSHFIMMNCGARGPYHYDPTGKTTWIDRFVDKLDNTTRAVGPTVSCEVSPHVQSYMMAVDQVAAKVLISFWGDEIEKSVDKLGAIRNGEVGASTAMIARGFNIAALDSRYAGSDFRHNNGPCGKEYKTIHSESYLLNPVACRPEGGLGCAGVEPCEVVFVKLGGELMATGFLPSDTSRNAWVREADKGSPICSFVPPPRPDWNAAKVWRSISNYQLNNLSFQRDTETEMVIIIRAHIGYGYHLISLLASMKTVPDVKLRALILCFGPGSYSGLRDLLLTHRFINETEREHASSPGAWSGLRISLMDVPEEVFTTYGSYLKSICTDSAKRLFSSIGYGPYEISRFCDVNSPLQYLLVDVLLHYIKEYCVNSRLVVVTNADNTYTPWVFKEMLRRSAQADVILTNTVNFGGILKVDARRGFVDLGSYATSVPFLRQTGLTFISAVPNRPLANDYHDVDGLFMEKLKGHNARISIIESFLFVHNRN